MRLNKTTKEKIADRIINDVPNPNHMEQARKLYQDFLILKMPEKVKAVYDDPALRGHLNLEYRHFSGCESIALYCERSVNHLNLSEDMRNQMKELGNQYQRHRNELRKMRSDIVNALANINTSLQLQKAYPEFKKYLPDEAEVIKTLPALTNIITDLRQLGWKNGN